MQKCITLAPGEEIRLVFMMGQGQLEQAKETRKKYSDTAYVDRCFELLGDYWEDKLSRLQVETPNQNMNTSLNIWNLYQS